MASAVVGEISEKATKGIVLSGAKEMVEGTIKETVEQAAKSTAKKSFKTLFKELIQKVAKNLSKIIAGMIKLGLIAAGVYFVGRGFIQREKDRCSCRDKDGTPLGDKYPTQKECEAKGNKWGVPSELESTTCILGRVGATVSDAGDVIMDGADQVVDAGQNAVGALAQFNNILNYIVSNPPVFIAVVVALLLLFTKKLWW